MGRGLLQKRPRQIYNQASLQLNSRFLPHLAPAKPAWVDPFFAIPPSQVPALAVPVQHRIANTYSLPDPAWFNNLVSDPSSLPPTDVELPTRLPQLKNKAKKTKPRNTIYPENIKYEEDHLRQVFFKDHPWELARPRILVEYDGRDATRRDWSKGLRQPGMLLCGECVVQRQMWLMHNRGMKRNEAYDIARKEFYKLRHEEEVERRMAKEEATFVGGHFAAPLLQASEKLEDAQHEDWKKWALMEAEKSTAAAHAQSNDTHIDVSPYLIEEAEDEEDKITE